MATTTQLPTPAHELHSELLPLPTLRCNDDAAVAADAVAWMKSTTLDTPVEEMRRRFLTDGYVLIRGLIPREVVLDTRAAYFAPLQEEKMLKPGTTPREAIFNPAEDPMNHLGIGSGEMPNTAAKMRKLIESHSTPQYLSFLQEPHFRTFIREFMGWEKDVLLARTMQRHSVPGGLSTAIHYDKIFLRAGEAEFLTAWVPVGDIPPNGGGLIYLEDSSPLGRAIEADFSQRASGFSAEEKLSAFNQNMGTNGFLSHDADAFGRVEGQGKRWLTADFRAGDVVFHDPYMIHGAARNEDLEGRIRLSTDLRFYEEGASLDWRWLNVWHPDDGL